MKIKLFTCILMLSVLFPVFASAQKVRMKYATKLMEKKEYIEAIEYFEDLAGIRGCDPKVLELAAFCNRKIGNYRKAEYWLSKLMRSKSPLPKHYVLYFRALLDNGKYKKAMIVYKEYMEKGFHDTVLDEYFSNGNFFQKNQLDSSEVCLFSLPMNSFHNELTPALRGNELFFGYAKRERHKGRLTSLNPGNIELRMADVYSETEIIENRSWKTANAKLNKETYVNFSLDSKTIFLNKVDRRKNKQLYWGKGDSLDINRLQKFTYNSRKYSVGRATLSPNGKYLVFSSDMKGSVGGVDLWVSEWKDEKWQQPQNLGENINTHEDEVMPNFVNDSTLCFSSEGLPGFGRFDMFLVGFKDGVVGKARNMGSPVNSYKSEIGVCWSPQYGQYLFASDRERSYDIYVYKKVKPKKQINQPVEMEEVKKEEILVENKKEPEVESIQVASVEKHQKEKVDVNKAEQREIATVTPEEQNTLLIEEEEVQPSKVLAEGEGFYYAIQVMAVWKCSEADSYFEMMFKEDKNSFEVVEEDGWLKYRTGHFNSYREALENANDLGYSQVYIVRMNATQVIRKIK
ncbi:hypothetical protein EMN47_00015 [Prolixibacteraceae bacterium JC049]|nr:hypothetical protein [Prolixibacteraceae bacterium JC049]